MGHSVDVAIIGAGVAGSSLAKKLAERGWETVLLDSQTFPRHKVCGEFLSPEARGTLKALGLEERVQALRPASIERARLIFDHGAEIEVALPGAAWGLSRYSLDAELHHAAQQAGAQLQTGTAVTDVHSIGTSFNIQTRQQGKVNDIQARTVIAAWGSNRRSGLPGNRTPSPKQSYMGVKTHYSGIAMDNAIEMYFFRGGYLGLCPIEDGHVNAAALLERESFAGTGKSIMSFMAAAVSRSPQLEARLAHAEPLMGTQAAVAPVYLNRKPTAWNELPLMGDAAAMIPPLCGDGMSMALRSADLSAPLAHRYLQGELSLAGWQKEYSRLIQSEFGGPMQWGSLLQWLFAFPALTRLIPAAAIAAPGLVQGLVRATRLKL